MSNKPDESKLISYLYGELDAKDSIAVQKYFEEHPEEKVTMYRLMDVLEVMGKVEDKEVIAPPVFMEEPPRTNWVSLWMTNHIRTAVGIAATLLLLLIAGRLIGPEISYAKGELRISFGDQKTEPAVQQQLALSPAQVQQMINNSLVKNNEVIAAEWGEEQEKWNRSITHSLDRNSKKIDGLMKEASKASQDQVRAFVANLQDNNLKSVQEYMQLSSAEQNKYMEGLLVDFSKYLNEQRKQDMQFFQTKIGAIEQNTDLFKQETEQILSSLINSPGERGKQSNYE